MLSITSLIIQPSFPVFVSLSFSLLSCRVADAGVWHFSFRWACMDLVFWWMITTGKSVHIKETSAVRLSEVVQVICLIIRGLCHVLKKSLWHMYLFSYMWVWVSVCVIWRIVDVDLAAQTIHHSKPPVMDTAKRIHKRSLIFFLCLNLKNWRPHFPQHLGTHLVHVQQKTRTILQLHTQPTQQPEVLPGHPRPMCKVRTCTSVAVKGILHRGQLKGILSLMQATYGVPAFSLRRGNIHSRSFYSPFLLPRHQVRSFSHDFLFTRLKSKKSLETGNKQLNLRKLNLLLHTQILLNVNGDGVASLYQDTMSQARWGCHTSTYQLI